MTDKYCEKHNQEYMEHVEECPICVGERMTVHDRPKASVKPRLRKRTRQEPKPEKKPRKRRRGLL